MEEPKKKVKHRFAPGNKFGKGRPPGTLSKERLVKESISEDDFKLLLNALKNKALGVQQPDSTHKIDLAAAKMIIDLLPVKTYMTSKSLAKIQTEEQIDKAMEDTLTDVGEEKLAIEDALNVTTLIERRGMTILKREIIQIEETKELEKNSTHE